MKNIAILYFIIASVVFGEISKSNYYMSENEFNNKYSNRYIFSEYLKSDLTIQEYLQYEKGKQDIIFASIIGCTFGLGIPYHYTKDYQIIGVLVLPLDFFSDYLIFSGISGLFKPPSGYTKFFFSLLADMTLPYIFSILTLSGGLLLKIGIHIPGMILANNDNEKYKETHKKLSFDFKIYNEENENKLCIKLSQIY